MITKYDELMSDPEFRKEMAIESLAAEASELIAKLMAEQNLSKADLARRLNKSRPWVTQLLSRKANMTVRTLAEVAFALGGEVKLHTAAVHKTAAEPARGQWKPIKGKTDPYRLGTRLDLFKLIEAATPVSDSRKSEAEYAA